MDQSDTSRIRHRRGLGLRHAISCSALLTLTLACCSTVHAVTFDWVTVGDPGNTNDATGYGGVGYTYRIGTYEVTNGQYAAFLNAVAKTDTYGLYSTNMATFMYGPSPRWGIGRTWTGDGYSYSALPGSANMPVGWLTWFNAVRFTNWVANGQPTGLQSGSTTENGAYALNGLMSGTGVGRNRVNPNTGLAPAAVIPTENEWYKAAYYSPTLNSGSGGYYLYATQSNTAPGNTIGSTPNQANYTAVVNGTAVYAVTQSPGQDYYQTYYTNVGTFAGSASYYGTFDQTGNQMEMVDAVQYGTRRMTRGGDWLTGAEWSKSTFRSDGFSPDVGYLNNGFRLAMVNTVAPVASGTVAVGAGGFADIPSATGGVVNATAGTAVIGTLAGATLNTGASGATVTTLTSGTINTSGGSVNTQGGSFSGSITGNGGITMSGTGTLVLSSANSYTGNTVINAGTVQIAVGDALGFGPAPIRIANNGRFKAMAGVAVTKPVVMSGTAAIYEHALSGTDNLTNLAPVSNAITTADIVAGDPAATTVASSFNGDGSLTLHGLDGTRFLMVLDMDGAIPADATPASYYLGWWDSTANANAGGWVNAVLGNHGEAGSLAGAYTVGYEQFLTNHGGWNGTTMLGAYGLDLANDQVWAVIDHNSDFGVANNGILVVPEPSGCVLVAVGLAFIACWAVFPVPYMAFFAGRIRANRPTRHRFSIRVAGGMMQGRDLQWICRPLVIFFIAAPAIPAAAQTGNVVAWEGHYQRSEQAMYTQSSHALVNGVMTQTMTDELYRLDWYKYPKSAADLLSSDPAMNWSLWMGQRFFWPATMPNAAAPERWNLALGRPVSGSASLSSTVGSVVREGFAFSLVSSYPGENPPSRLLFHLPARPEAPLLGTPEYPIDLTTNLQNWLTVSGSAVAVFHISPVVVRFAYPQSAWADLWQREGAIFGEFFDPASKAPLSSPAATARMVTPEAGSSGVVPEEFFIYHNRPITGLAWNTDGTTAPNVTVPATLTTQLKLDPWGEGYGAGSNAGQYGGHSHVVLHSNRVTVSSTVAYSEALDYTRDVTVTDGRVDWTNQETFSHIIHATDVSVSGTSPLVVSSSPLLGAQSQAAYQLWLSTETWAVQNSTFTGRGTIYDDFTGGARLSGGRIVNEGLIRFRCPVATGTSAPFENGRTLTVTADTQVLSGTFVGFPAGQIQADNGGYLNVLGDVGAYQITGFEGVSVRDGGRVSTMELTATLIRVTGPLVGSENNSRPELHVAGFVSASEIDLSGGGCLSVFELHTGSLTASGSTTLVEAGTLLATTVSLSAGASLTISGSATIGALSNVGGSVQANSTVNLSALQLGPGGIVQLSGFEEDLPQVGRVGLRWENGDHVAALNGYMQGGQLSYRSGLGNVRVVYDAESNTTLLIDPFSSLPLAVPDEEEVTNAAPIIGNTFVMKTGGGTLVLTGSNSHYAGTEVDGGRLVAGNQHAFGNGQITVKSGALDLASLPITNNVMINSGEILNATNYQGEMILGGTVSISGTVGGSVAVMPLGELQGDGTTFTGRVFVYTGALHAPGNSPGVQTFSGGLTYANASTLNWELIANTVAGPGSSYDILNVTGGDLLIDDGALLNLTFSGSGSTVNWTDPFWDVNRVWTIIDASGSASSLGNFTLNTIGDDSNSNSLGSIRPTAGFLVGRDGANVVLTYSPVPEPSSSALTLAGLAGVGFAMWRLRGPGLRCSTV